MWKIQSILTILAVFLLAWLIWLSYSSRGKLSQALQEIETARKEVRTALDENARALQLTENLRFELQRTADSMEILIAERDSAILAFKRWGSDQQYRKYNDALKVQNGQLEALRQKYRNLIASREEKL
ncbi:MAG: hypothetical protein IH599_10175 [Bacteroidales bacterium]|nr:hypothetical protein [Bacteroidales bacterium]